MVKNWDNQTAKQSTIKQESIDIYTLFECSSDNELQQLFPRLLLLLLLFIIIIIYYYLLLFIIIIYYY